MWKCEKCGLEIDRDYNASINILNEGLRILDIYYSKMDISELYKNKKEVA